jgi:hypothetical protein
MIYLPSTGLLEQISGTAQKKPFFNLRYLRNLLTESRGRKNSIAVIVHTKNSFQF